MSKNNKGFTFRVLCHYFRMQGHTGLALYNKVSKGLLNAQIRRGELVRIPDPLPLPE